VRLVGDTVYDVARVVPTANPEQLTDARESVDSCIDERSLQVDLVRLDRLFRSRRPADKSDRKKFDRASHRFSIGNPSYWQRKRGRAGYPA
jgi:hypothetical protein